MKKKNIITALTATLSVAMLSGSLITPAFASDMEIIIDLPTEMITGEMVNGNDASTVYNFKNHSNTYNPYYDFYDDYAQCKLCGEIVDEVDNSIDHTLWKHLNRDCTENKGNCRYCGTQTKEKGLFEHERYCSKNPNKDTKAQSSAKEEVEIFIKLPCKYCEECFDDIDAHEKECPENPDNKIPEIPDTIEVTEDKETPDTPEVVENIETPDTTEVTENKEIPNTTENEDEAGVPTTHAESSAKEEVEIFVKLPCKYCGECFDDIDAHEKDCPENPDNKEPETPETPETPEVPEQPETPETPEVPEQPETPVTPEEPEQPKEPVVTTKTLEGHDASAKERIELTIEF